MKKKIVFTLFIGCALAAAFITSCKKNDSSTATTTPTLDSQVSQHNTDNNNYQTANNETDQDITQSVSNTTAMGAPIHNTSGSGYRTLPGKTNSEVWTLCGTTIDSSLAASQKKLTFTFDGTTWCSSPRRQRAGQITVQLTSGNTWNDLGAVLTYTFTNYKVTYITSAIPLTTFSITFNGTKTLTNVNGASWWNFYINGDTLEYRERALGINVTFDNGQTATWNSAHTSFWSYTSTTSSYNFKLNGDTTVNGFNNASYWGVNRYGKTFTTFYNTPIISNSICLLWAPNAGQLVYDISNANYTLTFGVNPDGSTSTAQCAYGWKVSWVGTNSQTYTLVFPY